MDCVDVIREMEELMLQGPQTAPPTHIKEHLHVCQECRAEWMAQQETWMLMAAGLPKEEVHADLESRVMDRIKTVSGTNEPANVGARFWKYGLAASVLIALVGGSFFLPKWFFHGRASDQDLTRVTEFARQMRKLKELENAYANPEFRYVSLTTVGSSDHVQGYLVYDFFTNDAYFFGYELTEADGGTFMLWLLDGRQTVIASSAIDVNDQGVGAATIELPKDLDQLKEIVVSLEASLPVDAPSNLLKMRSNAAP